MKILFCNHHTMNDESIKDIIRNDDDLAETSKETLMYQLQTLQQRFEGPRTLLWALVHPDVLIPKIQEHQEYSIHTKYALVHAPVMIFHRSEELRNKYKDAFDKWKEGCKTFQEPITEKYDSNVATEKFEQGAVPWITFTKKRDSLPKGSMERLLLSMYSYLPPMRLDFGSVKIYREEPNIDEIPDNANYIVLTADNNYLGLQEYKTAKRYGKKVSDLPPELVQDIEDSLVRRPRDYLFVGKNDQPFDKSNTYGKWVSRHLEKIFKKHMTVNTLRHMFISNRQDKIENKCVKERKEIAAAMGHSIQTQMLYHYVHKKCKDE